MKLVRHRRKRAALGITPNVDPVDKFTLGHAAFGFMLGLWGAPWWAALVGTLGFELIENFVLKPAIPQIFPVGRPDTFANSTCDSLAWMSGWGAARLMFRDESEYAPIWRTA